MTEVAWARSEAERWVRPLGRRWQHVSAVARRAREIALAAGFDPDVLVSAAWLHDIGYARALAHTGFHPIDGARHLRRAAVDERVVSLVAHHSFALVDAQQRGLGGTLAEEFPAPEQAYGDALCTCDMTRGPAGEIVTAENRLNEIEERYGPDHLVTTWARRARPDILAAVARTQERMRVSESSGSRR